jgi:thiol-disulfide isomerase/thioredoxin
MMTAFLTELDQAVKAFIKRYPEDPRHWGAQYARVQADLFRAQVENKSPDRVAAETTLKEIISAKAAPESAQADARYTLIGLHIEALDDAGTPAARTEVEKEILDFQSRYAKDPRVTALTLLRAILWQDVDPSKAESLLKELAKDKDPRVLAPVQRLLQKIELKKKPIDLKFTAVDGREVDTGKLRGKVVLVDFWATWCPPCRGEMPNVVAAYQKYHDKGFEIVGISLDRDKERLLAFTKEKGMAWPQYFDGKQWENEISRRFEIQSIPTAWLLDKTGKVRGVDVRGAQLAKQVEKLLAE